MLRLFAAMPAPLSSRGAAHVGSMGFQITLGSSSPDGSDFCSFLFLLATASNGFNTFLAASPSAGELV
jgi:hypothetical protein